MNSLRKSARSLARLQEHLSPAQSVLVMTHDYPDPDCLASAMGLQHLLGQWGVHEVRIAYGGFIGRLENQALVKLTGMQAVPVGLLDITAFDKVILVDAYPGNGNVSTPDTFPFAAIIDHHRRRRQRRANCYQDIQPSSASTSSIVASYLRAASAELTPALATALFYGIKTDTHNMRHEVSGYDLETYRWLFPRVDYAMLADIEDPPRTREHYRLLHDSLEELCVYDTLGIVHLETIQAPDHVAEMADFIARLRELEWVGVTAAVDDVFYFSLRSKGRPVAGRISERIARKLSGSGGGHARRAAGQVPLNGREAADVHDRFAQSLRRALRIPRKRPESIFLPPEHVETNAQRL